MVYKLEKEKTGSTPYIMIDEEKGYMRFEGESFHENVIEFYRDVSNWLEEYLKTDFTEFTFDCELKYFNSSTAKLLLNMLLEMDENAGDGKNIMVNWITTEDNDIIVECGEDFQEEMNNLKFSLVIN
ncbi:hypothetical protein C4J81_03580 [Deltaproteobacteria bacterium Smac51]|nr:hypothetical protein C4J81_03580 [Deltaproteobacteria bacterium Smac51]